MTPETLWTILKDFSQKSFAVNSLANSFCFQHLIATTWTYLESPVSIEPESTANQTKSAMMELKWFIVGYLWCTRTEIRKENSSSRSEKHISHEITCARSWFSWVVCPHRRKAENIIRGCSSRNEETDKFWLIVLNVVNCWEFTARKPFCDSKAAGERTSGGASQFGGFKWHQLSDKITDWPLVC